MKKKKLWIALLVAFVVLAASVVYLNRAVTLVPSRFMRKIVCRLRLSEVSRQRRRRPEPPPSASCSCISCCPTGYLPHGAASRRPAPGRSCCPGMSPPPASVGGSHGSAARSRCWYGCGSSVRWENRSMSDFRFQPWPGTIDITTLLEFCSWLCAMMWRR